MNVLISSAGRRVSLVRSFQKELKKLDPKRKVFAVDSDPDISSGCHVADGYFKVPRLDNPDYFKTLLDICLKNNISLVIPTIDTELLPMAQQKSDFLKNGITLLTSKESFINKCRDKSLIHDFFKSNRVDIAKEYSKENFKLPLFIKPLDGSRSVDTFIIKKESDLTDYHFQNEKLMFLEYIDHNEFDEYTCDLYYNLESILTCVVPRKRIEVRDGEVNKGITVKNHLVDYIKEKLPKIEGAIGCLTAQFFVHKTRDQVYGIEINPRFGGGYPLSYAAGANFPKWILQEYFKGEIIEDKFDCWEDKLLMLRYDDEILVHGYEG